MEMLRPFLLNLNRSKDQTFSSDSLPGKLYEKSLFLYTLINNPKQVFDLGREIRLGDKWDDLVVKEKENNYNHYTFVQVKLINDSHDEDNFITSDVLLGRRKISLNEHDFMLQKYLISFLRAQDQFSLNNDNSKIKKLIIFTNAKLNESELNKNVGNIIPLYMPDINDVIPNTNQDCLTNKNISYKIVKIKKNFVQKIKVNLKSDYIKLAEDLVLYAINSKRETMTLDEDYYAYYHKSLFDENVLEVTGQQHGNKIIKKGKFTECFINGQKLSERAQNLRKKLLDIIKKHAMTEQELQNLMKAAAWTVSNDFDLFKTQEFMFLPNYDINDKDIVDFFDRLEIRSNQLGVKDVFGMIMNYQIKKTFLEYYDTDPEIVEFLINEFIKGWRSNTPGPEQWILNEERSRFIEQLTIKISKPRAVHKTLEHLTFLDDMCKSYNLYYDESCLFNKKYFKDAFVAIRTASNILSSVKMIQSLIKINKQDIIFIDFSKLVQHKEIIKLVDAFWSKEFSLLIMSYTHALDESICDKLFNKLLKITKENREKTVIFVTSTREDSLTIKFSNLPGFKEYCDKLIGLQYLTNASKILEQKIFVQGQSMNLSDFIDETSYSLVNADTIEDLIKSKNIQIGSNLSGISELAGSYSDHFEDINIYALVERLSQKSNCIYLINGFLGSNLKTKLLNAIVAGIVDVSTTLNIDNIKNSMEILNQNNINKSMDKKVQLCDFALTKKIFQQICQNNAEKKIYWIRVANIDNTYKLTLEQIYNPNFYVTGKRFNVEVVLERNIKFLLISNKLTELFIVNLKYKNEFENWLQLVHDKEKKQFDDNCESNKIMFVTCIDTGKTTLHEIIQNNLTGTVHLVKFEQNDLIWCETYGSLENLSRFRAKNYNNVIPLLGENDIVQNIKDEKVAIIVGDPGIGKSTTLVKLYESKYTLKCGLEESLIQSHWLIKVNLKDHLQHIQDINTITNDAASINKEIVSFLSKVDPSVNSDFAKNLLSVALMKTKFKKPILILFDGFDEILDSVDRRNILFLLRCIKNQTKAKFWVTSRLHFKSTLENELSKFAIIIEKMTDDQVHEIITKILKNYLSLSLNSIEFKKIFDTYHETIKTTRIFEYTRELITTIQKVFKGDISKFIGTPLQLNLMLEDSARHFLKWVKDDNYQTPSFSFLGTDMWAVYENFIQRKYNIYFKKSNVKERIRQEQDRAVFDDHHRSLAKSLMFKTIAKKDLVYFQDIILLAGIVKSQENDMEFIHATFTEYFVAKEIVLWIAEWNKESSNQLMNLHNQKILFEEVFLKSEFEMVRKFLNIKLLKEKYENIDLPDMYYNDKILFIVTKENHVGIMRFLIRNIRKANVNAYNSIKPFLHVAVHYGYLEMTKFLIESNADVNSKDGNSASVLHKSAEFGDLTFEIFLKQCSAYINSKDNYNSTVLHSAYVSKNLEIADFLISNGAFVNAKDEYGVSVMHMAILYHNLDMVKLLIKKGADVDSINNDGISILHRAVEHSNLELVNLLIANGANVNSKDNRNKSVLHYAVESDKSWVFKLLLFKHADDKQDENNLSELYDVSKYHDFTLEIVKILVSNGAKVNTEDVDNKSVLHTAAECLNLEMIKYLVVNGANVKALTKSNKSVLHSAVEFNIDCTGGKFEEVNKWYGNHYQWSENLVLPYEKNHQIRLQEACKIVEYLSLEGAPINIQDCDGKSVLHRAAEHSYFEIMECLLKNGADVNSKDNHNKSVLYSAVETGNFNIVKLLIFNHADINSRDNNNLSVLQRAIEILKSAIALFPDAGSKDNNNKLFRSSSLDRKSLSSASNNHRIKEHMSYKIVDFLVSSGAYDEDKYGWLVLQNI